MNTDLDQHLTNDQWNMLRALRPAAPTVKLNAYVLQQLGALGLVTLSDSAPLLWDLAA